MRTLFFLSALTGLLILSACGGEAGAKAIAPAPPATDLSALIATAKPVDAISVTAAKVSTKPGDAVVVQGRIGGRAKPFITGRAAFLLADPDAIVACDAMPDDHCDVPWDFCCEDPSAVAKATGLVQITGADGRALKQDINGLGGLTPGSFVVITGTIATQATADNLIINAETIYPDTTRTVVKVDRKPKAGQTHGSDHGQ